MFATRLVFRQKLSVQNTLLESESFPLSAAAAGVGGEGPRCQGTGCGQSLLAGCPGSGRCPGLTQAGRSLRPPTRSRTRNFKLAGELDLVFQAPAGRVMGQISYSKAVPETGQGPSAGCGPRPRGPP